MAELFIKISEWDYTATPPSAYGTFHLLFTVLGFLFCALAALGLRKIGERGSNAILLAVGIFLAVTEIYKQLFYYYAMDSYAHYHWWIFPFQLCSIPMYLCLIIPFLREGRVKGAMYNFLASYNLLGGFIAFFEPSGLIHSHWTLTLHAFVWHMLIVFVGVFVGISGRANLRGRGFLHNAVFFVGLAAVAFAINLSLRGVSAGSVNMFYVGPSNSPLIVFNTICEKLGWYVNTPLYLLALTAGAFLISLPFRFVRNSGYLRKI
ncbi:MAG: YwaF family protein [Clostridia bacterium]|nr:YwaF family protein [Clostridia bacterium]